VCVVDSGVDADHPDVGSLSASWAYEWDREQEAVVEVPSPHTDLYGHGTACAGIIRRAAPRCSLESIRVLGSKLQGKGEVFAVGLRAAIQSGAQVVNLSLSTGKPEFFPVFHELAEEAYFKGVILVCAVNNVPAPSFPSQFASVISVAANGGTGPYDLDCNPNPPVEFGAPGIRISVPWTGGGNIEATGNSFAAPHVAGLVARLLSKHPGLTPYDVKAVLRAVSRNRIPSP
jgi:subtilisin